MPTQPRTPGHIIIIIVIRNWCSPASARVHSASWTSGILGSGCVLSVSASLIKLVTQTIWSCSSGKAIDIQWMGEATCSKWLTLWLTDWHTWFFQYPSTRMPFSVSNPYFLGTTLDGVEVFCGLILWHLLKNKWKTFLPSASHIMYVKAPDESTNWQSMNLLTDNCVQWC